MKIIIISGFLGAGKTTFIKQMVAKTGKNFVIVENEFGELGIDGELLKQSKTTNNKDIKVWELTEGCICCSLNLDFTYSILTIANSLNPDYLLIEPSGVAKLSSIIKQLNKITYENITIAPPITIIDGKNYLNNQQQFSDFFYDQLAMAGTIVVSKSESFSDDDFTKLLQCIKYNHKTEYSTTHYSQWTKKMWLALLNKEMQIKTDKETGRFHLLFHQPTAKNTKPLETLSIKNLKINNIEQLSFILLALTTPSFGCVVRAKGYCKIADHWVKFDLVDNQYAITGCEPMPNQRAVCIGKELKQNEINILFSMI